MALLLVLAVLCGGWHHDCACPEQRSDHAACATAWCTTAGDAAPCALHHDGDCHLRLQARPRLAAAPPVVWLTAVTLAARPTTSRAVSFATLAVPAPQDGAHRACASRAPPLS